MSHRREADARPGAGCYDRVVTPEDVKAFMARDWAAVSDSDAAHWVAEFAERGPSATVDASRTLWEHARRTRPDWPTADDSARDLADLLRFTRLLDRAAHAFAHR